jgi:hypothetical protein
VANDPPRNLREYAAQVWRKPPPFAEKITTDHHLEASGAAAFRREVFARVGFFDESLRRAEDTDMTRRLRDAGIEVHYYPFQEIRHQYSPIPVDTLSKCFRTGFNRCKLYQKRDLWPRKGETVLARIVIHKLGVLFDALQRARHAETTLKILLYLPFMFLFEVANKVGFLCGLVCARRSPSATVAGKAAANSLKQCSIEHHRSAA